MTGEPVPVVWSTRSVPLEAAAVAASGPARDRLRDATLPLLAAGAELTAVQGDGWLVVLGAADGLPWADGVTYLGWDADLLMPTTMSPEPSAAVLREALPAAPVRVVLPGRLLLAPLPLRAADPGRLAWPA